MKKYHHFLLPIFFLLLFSCSGKRHLRQESNTALQTQYSQQWRADRQQQDSLNEFFRSHYVQTIDLLTLYPTDTFTYHPDGSFSGMASGISLWRIHTRRVDSSARSAYRQHQRIDTFAAVDSRQIDVAHSFSETRWTPRFRTGVTLAFVFVLGTVLWLFGRFFRR